MKYTFIYDSLSELGTELNASEAEFKNSWSVHLTTLEKWMKIIDKGYEDVCFIHGVNTLNIRCVGDGGNIYLIYICIHLSILFVR